MCSNLLHYIENLRMEICEVILNYCSQTVHYHILSNYNTIQSQILKYKI